MKWVVFISALLVGVPAMVVVLRAAEKYRRMALVVFFVLLLNTLEGSLAINIVSRELYRGWSRGMEITALDLFSLGVALYVLLTPSGANRRRTPYEVWVFAAFLFFAFASFALSWQPLYAWFGWWKLVRGFAVFAVFSRFLDDEERVRLLPDAFAILCFYQAFFVLQQKYLHHIYRTTGTLPHMNTLAIAMNMLMIPVFAVFLMDDRKPKLWYVAAFGAGVFNILATMSRGALITMLAAVCVSLSFVRRRNLSAKRATTLAVMAIAGVIAGWKASDSIMERFMTAPKESAETRDELNVCAAKMARDFPLGVGVNNYSYMIGKTVYGESAPQLPEGGRDDGVAHHIYWLVASEMGWVGLVAFLALVGAFTFDAFRLAVWGRRPFCKAMGVGLFCGFMALHFQGFLEWIFVQTNIYFLFCAQCGALVAIRRLDRDPDPG